MPSPADLMLGHGGVALADSADASRCYPELWRTPAAARQAFHRARSVTGRSGGAPEGERHAPTRRATYQRAGAGKRPASLVFDPAVVGDLRSWLEERIGPLARLAVDGPAAEPAAGSVEACPAEAVQAPLGAAQEGEVAQRARLRARSSRSSAF